MKRNNGIDIIKGIGIILVVIGHSGIFENVKSFIYLFHMAIFFMVAGYCFKEKSCNDFHSVFGYIIRKLKSLYIPYVIWTIIYSLLNNTFIRMNIYTNKEQIDNLANISITTHQYWNIKQIITNIIKGFFLQGSTTMGGAMWFIATLLEISIGYAVIGFVLRKLLKESNLLVLQSTISIVFLGIGFTCSLMNKSFYMIEVFFSCYCLFHAGYLLKVYSEKVSKVLERFPQIILLISSFCILVICNRIGYISLGGNHFENPVFLFLTSASGFLLLWVVASYIQKSIVCTKLFCCIGQNTMSVLLLHFLCFKIVSYLGVLILGDPLEYVASFPVLYTGGVWWIAYSFAGVTIPVLLSLCWRKAKNSVLQRAK